MSDLSDLSDTSDLSDYYPRQRRQRRRPLLDLKIPLVALAILAGWFGWRFARRTLNTGSSSRSAVLGGQVVYDSSFREGRYSPGTRPPSPSWVDRLCGADFAHSVVMVSLKGPQVNDETLELVGGLAAIRTLNLVKTNITDAGLAHLRKLSDLRELDLSQSRVCDDGLAQLGHHPRLESLPCARPASAMAACRT